MSDEIEKCAWCEKLPAQSGYHYGCVTEGCPNKGLLLQLYHDWCASQVRIRAEIAIRERKAAGMAIAAYATCSEDEFDFPKWFADWLASQGREEKESK